MSHSALQRNSRHSGVRESGCVFCSGCYIGGLNTIQEMDDAFDWAVSQGWVQEYDASMLVRPNNFMSGRIAERYGRQRREGCTIEGTVNVHVWVCNSSGRVVYNSSLNTGPQPSGGGGGGGAVNFPYLATFNDTVRCRAGSSTNANQYATYYPNEQVWVHDFVESEGRIWLVYHRNSGGNGYCCARDTDGSVYINPFNR
jgi:hypothetical protein